MVNFELTSNKKIVTMSKQDKKYPIFLTILIVGFIILDLAFLGIAKNTFSGSVFDAATPTTGKSQDEIDSPFKTLLKVNHHYGKVEFASDSKLPVLVEMKVFRPVHNKEDIILDVSKVNERVFDTQIPKDLKEGQWEFMVIITDTDGKKYQVSKRFYR